MSTFQQQMMDTYPQDPSTVAAPTYGQGAYPAYPDSGSSGWSWPTLKDPATGAYTPFAAALILAVLFLVLASPPVFQFMAKTLGKLLTSVSWIAPSGMPSSKLLLVHTLVYGILAYVVLCLLTNAHSQ
jgi:hypothetical protein